MNGLLVAIFHQAPRDGDPPLTHLLAEARHRLVSRHVTLFLSAGAERVRVVPGREDGATESFGERVVRLLREENLGGGGLVLLGSGAVPLLRAADARRLVGTATSPGRVALTNNRYSSDVCAVSDAAALADLPALPSDNALPRWLEERAGFRVGELTARDRLAIDLDTPLDLALLALVPGAPRSLREVAVAHGLIVPRRDALRELAADPRRELLVFGRSSSRTLRWLEQHVRCRVRFLAEERGLRASSELAIGGDAPAGARARRTRPRSATLGMLLEQRGPEALAAVVGRLADGALIDSRVLMAHRFGADEDAWPSAEDRFASDLHQSGSVSDPWLRALTAAAADAPIPIQLGAHTLIGPGIPSVLRGASAR